MRELHMHEVHAISGGVNENFVETHPTHVSLAQEALAGLDTVETASYQPPGVIYKDISDNPKPPVGNSRFKIRKEV